MARMFFSQANCMGATSGATGRNYNADKGGLITVTDPVDIKNFKAAGYVEAGAVARGPKYWVCDDCSWDANLNHCPKCGSEDLRKVTS